MSDSTYENPPGYSIQGIRARMEYAHKECLCDNYRGDLLKYQRDVITAARALGKL